MKAVMGSIILLAFFLTGISAHASDPTVTISSFYYTDSHGRVAELCGKISGTVTYPVLIKIVIDENSKTPANYSVSALSDSFCTMVVSDYGVASASIWKP